MTISNHTEHPTNAVTGRMRFAALLLVAAAVLTVSTFTGSPAHAEKIGSLLTLGCGNKTAQLNWTSTGEVHLFGSPDRDSAGTNLLRIVKKNGSYSYNSGYHTFTFQIGASTGHVTSLKQVCVAQN
ncbi:hypothetical protein [Curtobacterium sp. 9128]|uniref:hypothetical protein n=1 Tax=Curtobacterium sp. 9128 TaxID=1793722 RepID=UPI0011A56610|nr:hypothetical protein [Curtobacterium sp. 9128]